MTIGMNTTFSYASTNVDETSLSTSEISEVTSLVEVMLGYESDLVGSEFKLGNYIPTYNWNGETFTIDSSAYRYPVYADGEIVSIYTIIDPETDSPARQFGEEYANELNALLNENSEYFLVGYDDKAYAVVDGNVTLIADYSSLSLESGSGVQAMSAESDELASLEAAVAYSSFDVNTDQSNIDTLVDINPIQTRDDNYRYFNVETYDQGSRNICWAVAATRIGNFMSDTEYVTPIEAVDYINEIRAENGEPIRDAGNIFDAQDVLSDFYDINADYYDDGCTWDEVADYIEDATLLYAAFYDSEFTTGHAVCVNGYYIDGSEGILIMESLGGEYRQLLAGSSGKYKMNYTGLGNLNWEASLIVPWQN